MRNDSLNNRFLNRNKFVYQYYKSPGLSTCLSGIKSKNNLNINKIDQLRIEILSRINYYNNNNSKKKLIKENKINKILEIPNKISDLKKSNINNLHIIGGGFLKNNNFIRSFHELYNETTRNKMINDEYVNNNDNINYYLKRLKEINYNDNMAQIRNSHKSKDSNSIYKNRSLKNLYTFVIPNCNYKPKTMRQYIINMNNNKPDYCDCFNKTMSDFHNNDYGSRLTTVNNYSPLRVFEYSFDRLDNYKGYGAKTKKIFRYHNELERNKWVSQERKFRNFSSYSTYSKDIKNKIENKIYNLQTKMKLCLI